MFKDILALVSVVMHSNNDANASSMISSFENCENLNDFTITGFNTAEVKSMRNLFYKSGLSYANLVGFSTDNVEDFSYMFASVSSRSINIEK